MKRIHLIILVLAAGAGYGGWRLYRATWGKPVSADAAGATVKVTKGDVISRVTESGILDSVSQVKIKANATGRVKKLNVDLGARVKAGQVLAVIQPGRPGEAYRPSTVISPMKGVVIYKGVEEGDIVTSGLSEYNGGTHFLTVADLGTMMVQFQVNEVDMPKIHLGQQATVSLDALPGKTYKGLVQRLSPMAQVQAGGSIRVFDTRVQISGSNGELMPGMSATVVIVTDERLKVLTLPVETVFSEEGVSVVYRRKAGKLERVVVKTGISDNQKVEIVSGLGENNEISKQRPQEVAEKSKQSATSGGEEWW